VIPIAQRLGGRVSVQVATVVGKVHPPRT